MIDNYPSAPAKADKLAQLEADYKTVFATLRTERGFRETMLRKAEADKIEYWRKWVEETQKAMDALVRIKDVAKLALLEQQVSVAEQWKQEELIQDVEFRPVRLNY